MLSLIFVGLLLFELWERSVFYLSCWGGGFFALFDICTDFVICCQSSSHSSLVRLLQYPDFRFRSRRRKVFGVVGLCASADIKICSVVTSVNMSGTVAIGVDGVIEIDGPNVQILANVAARGEVTFILLPGQMYDVHLHDANGRLIGAMRLDIPGGGNNTGDGGDSPYGSGQVGRPQVRRRTREISRPRRLRPMRCGFRRRRGANGESLRDGDQSVRDDDTYGLPPNMAIRTRDRSPRRSPSSSSDVDVVGE